MIIIFFMYLWDVILMLLIIFKKISCLHGLLCFIACLKIVFTFFIWQSLYTFMQYIEYKNGEQFHLLIPAIQNSISQKLSLYLNVDLR
jgi:hypothetical protein